MKTINRIGMIVEESIKKYCKSTNIDFKIICGAYASLWEREIRNRFGEYVDEDQIVRYVKDRMREIFG